MGKALKIIIHQSHLLDQKYNNIHKNLNKMKRMNFNHQNWIKPQYLGIESKIMENGISIQIILTEILN